MKPKYVVFLAKMKSLLFGRAFFILNHLFVGQIIDFLQIMPFLVSFISSGAYCRKRGRIYRQQSTAKVDPRVLFVSFPAAEARRRRFN